MAAIHRSIPLSTGWRYKAVGPSAFSSTSSWQPSRPLPTEIYLDLLENGAIPNPFLGKNEEAVQWVADQTWLYETYFEIPQDALDLPQTRVALVFEGLDTYATVRLNDLEILKSDNMFVCHRVEISEDVLVKAAQGFGRQHLQITFDNAQKLGDEEVARYPNHQWLTMGAPTRLATRKAQYHYGWDWGPKLVTCGPWKPIYLDISSSRIADVSVQTSLGQDLRDAKVDIVAKVDGDALHANIEILSKGVLVQSQRVKVQSETAHAIFNIKHPDLWWPFTLGPANLYEVNVSLHTGGDSAPCVVDEVKKSFGIRKVELIQQPLPGQEGTSFFFKVNNVPIFAAGSCWIPADSFLTRLTPQKYRDWVTLAREANQVMIRIWGGGIYEDEAFYNSCDELGVLVWQDFMFACGIYPAYEPMQKRVAVEADQNVRRLRHHPSIVLWCGNNEDYAIPLIVKMEYDAEEKDPQKVLGSSFPARYFYEHMLPAICNDLAPDTPYWPGSPFGGSMCNSQEIGDIHQWHVWHMDKFPYQDYPRLSGRFVSEFGMQALPGLDTVKEYFPPGHEVLVGGDVSANEYLEWHNKNEAGASTLALYGQNNIPFETTSLPAYIYCTQLIQNETLSTAYRSWRRLWRGPGKEYCAGALVWQLNDCWPVTSWAIADYRLRPKMAYWAVKRECAPITAGAARIKEQDRTTKLDVWAVNMTLADVQVNVSIDAWHTVTGEKLLNHSMHRGLTLKENRSAELGILDLDSILSARLPASEREQGYRNVAFAVRLNKSATPVYRLAQSINFHEPLHEVSFQAGPADLKTRITKRGIATVLEITTSFPVKGFLVEITDDADATWDENGIDLVPGETTVLKCTSQGLRVGQEHRLKARWLGGEWEGGRDIKASL